MICWTISSSSRIVWEMKQTGARALPWMAFPSPGDGFAHWETRVGIVSLLRGAVCWFWQLLHVRAAPWRHGVFQASRPWQHEREDAVPPRSFQFPCKGHELVNHRLWQQCEKSCATDVAVRDSWCCARFASSCWGRFGLDGGFVCVLSHSANCVSWRYGAVKLRKPDSCRNARDLPLSVNGRPNSQCRSLGICRPTWSRLPDSPPCGVFRCGSVRVSGVVGAWFLSTLNRVAQVRFDQSFRACGNALIDDV